MVSRSGARATISRAMNWTSGASSTRWKSSKIRIAPYGAIERSSRMKTSTTASRVGPLRLGSASIDAVFGANDGSTSRPAATRWFSTEIQSRSSSSSRYQSVRSRVRPREVGEERGLAVPGVGQQQDDPLVDLRGEPVEEPMARQGLLAQRRRLDLRVLDRVAAHVVAVGSADLRGDGGISDRDRPGRASARQEPAGRRSA